MTTIVLCTGNSTRSALLEAVLNRLGPGGVNGFSAGSQPTERVHPQALAILHTKGLDTSGDRSKNWDEFASYDAPEMEVGFTVCGNAAAKTCLIWPGAPLSAHWLAEDPAAANIDARPAAFAQAFELMHNRTNRFVAAQRETVQTEPLLLLSTEIGNS